MNQRLIYAFFMAISVPNLAHAYDIFSDLGYKKQVVLDGVPNYDQRRHSTNVTENGQSEILLGLAGDGSEFCVPTSTIEWTDFLANRGYPNLLPGPGPTTGSWTDGETGRGEYNLVDLSIAFLAADMQTSATNGTYGGPAQTGAQQFLDSEYLGKFCTVNIEADNTGYPRIVDLINAELNGNLIATFGGWYQTTTYNKQTVYYRNGGHCTAMASATWQNNSATLGLANPWTYDDLTLQSAEGLSTFTTTASTINLVNVDNMGNVVAGSEVSRDVDFLDTGSNWILDGALEIQPLDGYTIHENVIYHLSPYAFIDINDYATGYKASYTFDRSPVYFATRNPLSGLIYYTTTEHRQYLYAVDPFTGDSSEVVEFPGEVPKQVLFGATFEPYALFGDGSVAQLDLNTGDYVNTVNFDTEIRQIAFNPSSNELAAIDPPSGKYFLLDKRMQRVGPAQHFPVPQGSGQVFTQFGPKGHLFVWQSGDPYLYENIPTTNGSTVTVKHYLPAVQNASSFAVDDWGALYFSNGGVVTVLNSKGGSVASNFNGLPGGEMFTLNHSLSNWDPSIQTLPSWRDTVPPYAFGGNTDK